MPIYAKWGGAWYQGNSPTSNLIFARQSNYWYAAAFIYAKWGGVWYNTGYQGKPGQCQNQQIVSAADNFGQIAVGYWGPSSGGPVDYYIVRMYDQNGTYLTGNRSDTPGNQPGLHYFGVKPDNRYQFKVFAVNAAGEGPETPAVRYATGHLQQTAQQAVYGWGPEYDWSGGVVDWSTEMAGHEHNLCGDWGGNPQYAFTTSWISGSRAAANRAEGVRFQPQGIANPDYARLASVRMWMSAGRRLFVGLYSPATGWRGGTNYLTDRNLWFNGLATFAHDYCHMSGIGVAANTEYNYRCVDEGVDLRASQVLIDCAVDNLDSISGGYRGGFTEVILRFQNWTIVSYNTVITVAQINNYYW